MDEESACFQHKTRFLCPNLTHIQRFFSTKTLFIELFDLGAKNIFLFLSDDIRVSMCLEYFMYFYV